MNAHVHNTRNALTYSGHVIRDRDEMLSLTDMWKAAGKNPEKRPDDWKKDASNRAFLGHVASIVNTPVEGIWASKRGNGGGTFAHWQVALAYAKYLSPEFHMWCNEVVRERMEGRAVAPVSRGALSNLSDYDRAILGNIVKNCVGVVIREQIAEILPRMVEAYAAQSAIMIRRGKTAGQIWRENNMPRMRGAANWFGNRLAEMGCGIENEGRAELGSVHARLFDPDKVNVCLRNGLLHKAKLYAQERAGQGRLRLIEG